jgi:hypothetical protein
MKVKIASRVEKDINTLFPGPVKPLYPALTKWGEIAMKCVAQFPARNPIEAESYKAMAGDVSVSFTQTDDPTPIGSGSDLVLKFEHGTQWVEFCEKRTNHGVYHDIAVHVTASSKADAEAIYRLLKAAIG